jgi:GMP synthase-like glutamine amidotransferase
MRVHWLQHTATEDLGSIEPWLAAAGYDYRGTRLYAGEAPPKAIDGIDGFDALIVMGGPMNIYEHDRHSWLLAEKQLIRAAIDGGKRVLGICLGAQLVADQLGGEITRNAEPEIGWHDVALTDAGRRHPLLADWPSHFAAFHWHFDTFALPPGAEHLASSAGCINQAFAWDGGRVLGLQFHPEVGAAHVAGWLRGDDLPQGRYVQTPVQMLNADAAYAASRRLLHSLLGRFLSG